jgi:hypothetical protein
MKSFIQVLILVVLVILPWAGKAQNTAYTGYFRDVVLNTDTSTYSLSNNQIIFKGEKHLAFEYRHEDAVAEIRLFPVSNANMGGISLQPSGDFELVDSLTNFNDDHIRFKVKFKNISKSQFLNFTFQVQDALTQRNVLHEVKLFPYTNTFARFYPENDELFIGEEKIYELVTNNIGNIRVDNAWTTGEDIDYRITERNGTLRLHLLPSKLGVHTARVALQTNKPFLDGHQRIRTNLPVITHKFNVKASRLAFLNIDQRDVVLDEESRKKGIEIQLDNSRLLSLHKTYRIENQEEPGGALVAEIYTRSQLSNGKILCWLRLFNYHRKSEGYLYIKDGDAAKFITNFSISPKTTISQVSVLREGSDWNTNLQVRPGETVEVKIEGEGLHRSRFYFDGTEDISPDSLMRNENQVVYRLNVPINISKRKIELYNNGNKTGVALNVREYQTARQFDFVQINYGDKDRIASTMNQPVLYNHTIKDVVISFLPHKIDQDRKPHGKQYLQIEVKMTGSKGELVELRTIDNIVVCPSESSPRFAFYEDKQCNKADINLNNYLSRKTYDLDEWSRIYITIRHQKDKHNGDGYEQRVELVVKKSYKFDVDVSFPAGLLVKKVGEEGFGNLGGISLAMIAQFSFYHPEKISKLRPYKFGAGFLAFNAFDFTPPRTDSNGNLINNRDVGVVVLASLYPIQRGQKLSFPLFAGGGYFMGQGKFFYLIGPGIQVRL